ncbi:MAG: hypothetical protein DMF66_11665, partial [Acidobacteria bacterium]
MTKRSAGAFLTVLALTLTWQTLRAQEGDLTSSAGVFIDPPHAKARHTRSDRGSGGAGPRRAHPHTSPTP